MSIVSPWMFVVSNVTIIKKKYINPDPKKLST